MFSKEFGLAQREDWLLPSASGRSSVSYLIIQVSFFRLALVTDLRVRPITSNSLRGEGLVTWWCQKRPTMWLGVGALGQVILIIPETFQPHGQSINQSFHQSINRAYRVKPQQKALDTNSRVNFSVSSYIGNALCILSQVDAGRGGCPHTAGRGQQSLLIWNISRLCSLFLLLWLMLICILSLQSSLTMNIIAFCELYGSF